MATRRSSNKKPSVADARERYVSQVRLRYFLQTISAVHIGAMEAAFEGDEREGRFFCSNTSGGHHAVAWDAVSVVAMAFDHKDAESEGPLPPGERNPERLFQDAPASLEPLFQRLTRWHLTERLGTAARWISPEGEGGTLPSERLEGYEQTPKEALASAEQGWRELAFLSKTHARIATRLAKPAGGVRQLLDAEDGRALLTPPKEYRDVVPDARNVAIAVQLFASAGVDWPDGVEMATRLASADPDLGYALIDATFGGDLETVRALVAKGAKVDKRARAGQLPGWREGGGETPLSLALDAEHTEIVRVLLDGGANPNTKGALYHPLAIAARRGNREMCELLIARGAKIEPLRTVLFLNAMGGQSADVVDLVLDLDVEIKVPWQWDEKMAALAERANRPDLVARFLKRTEVERAHRQERQTAQAEVAAIASHCRMLHIVNAVRGIHHETGFRSDYKGTPEEGQFASTTTTKDGVEHVVIAWNYVGLVGWAWSPQIPLLAGDPSPIQKPWAVFGSAPEHLRPLYDQAVRWAYDPQGVTEALWIFVHAGSSDGMRGAWGQTQNTGLWRKGTPIEATQLDAGLAALLSDVVQRSAAGSYPQITPEAEAAILAPQPEGTPTPRLEGVAEAVKRFAQIRVRWDGAEARAEGIARRGP